MRVRSISFRSFQVDIEHRRRWPPLHQSTWRGTRERGGGLLVVTIEYLLHKSVESFPSLWSRILKMLNPGTRQITLSHFISTLGWNGNVPQGISLNSVDEIRSLFKLIPRVCFILFLILWPGFYPRAQRSRWEICETQIIVIGIMLCLSPLSPRARCLFRKADISPESPSAIRLTEVFWAGAGSPSGGDTYLGWEVITMILMRSSAILRGHPWPVCVGGGLCPQLWCHRCAEREHQQISPTRKHNIWH